MGKKSWYRELFFQRENDFKPVLENKSSRIKFFLRIKYLPEVPIYTNIRVLVIGKTVWLIFLFKELISYMIDIILGLNSYSREFLILLVRM